MKLYFLHLLFLLLAFAVLGDAAIPFRLRQADDVIIRDLHDGQVLVRDDGAWVNRDLPSGSCAGCPARYGFTPSVSTTSTPFVQDSNTTFDVAKRLASFTRVPVLNHHPHHAAETDQIFFVYSAVLTIENPGALVSDSSLFALRFELPAYVPRIGDPIETSVGSGQLQILDRNITINSATPSAVTVKVAAADELSLVFRAQYPFDGASTDLTLYIEGAYHAED